MRRLTYSPRVNAYIKTNQGTIVDVSSYIVRGNVHRKVNQVSSARLELRNPDKRWTKPGAPTFHPMDPITIYLTRLRGRPIQVFTGYLDTTPYLQLFPDVVALEASCTLKRLMYTYWDPGLPFVREFMTQYGWQINQQTGQLFNPSIESKYLDATRNKQLSDGSIGNLLFAVLKWIGNWTQDTIFIERLPEGIVQAVTRIYNELSHDDKALQEELKGFLTNMIGTGSAGSGGGTGNSGGATSTGELTTAAKVVPVIAAEAHRQNIPPEFAVAVCLHESGLGTDMLNAGSGAEGYYQWLQYAGDSAPGSYQKCGLTDKWPHSKCRDLGIAAYAFCRSARLALNRNSSFAHDFVAWAEYVQGATGQFSSLSSDVTVARGLVNKYGDGQADAKAHTSANAAAPADTIPRDSGPANNDSGSNQQTTDQKIYAPIAGGTTTVSSPFGEKNHGTPPHTHMGIDVPVPQGTACIAPVDGRIGQYVTTSGFGDAGGMVHFIFEQDVGQIKAGTVIGWGHVSKVFVKPGQKVTANTTIALSNHPAPHVHFIMRTDDNDLDGTVDPTPVFRALQQGKTSPTAGGSVDNGGANGGGADQTNASAFATFLSLPGAADTALSLGLQGQKSLMNDQPLLPFVQQLSEASLRNFMSLPNGDFYAFFPDYFGGFGRAPYWLIDDLEVIEGGLDLSDDALATHVYVVGDTLRAASLGGDNVHFLEQLQSGGVMTIYNAFKAGFINLGEDGTEKKILSQAEALSFLTKFGARPHYEDAPMVRSPYFEAFLAWQRFMLLWAAQFRSKFQLTFMPEVFPGGIVAFDRFDIQCYVEEVIHNFDYEGGFTSEAILSAPAAMPGATTHVSQGLVAASATTLPGAQGD